MVCHRRTSTSAVNHLWSGLIGVILMLVVPFVHAASVSFSLDQSNKLSDGTPYLSVMLTENGAGGVDFQVQTLDSLNSIAGPRFGIQKFGFGLNGISWHDIGIEGLPDHWSVKKNRRMSEFGKFDFRLQGKGNARTDSLSFTVNGVNLSDFDSLFSAQVAGFEWCRIEERRPCGGRDCTNSAYFAGSMDMPVGEVPVPGALLLFGSGMLGLMSMARRRKG